MYDNNAYYDVPHHRMSRHSATDEDHSYYQNDWLRNEAVDIRDVCVDTGSQRCCQANNGSDSSSILYQRACM